jgi:DNA-directed RNA polymerase subunit F
MIKNMKPLDMQEVKELIGDKEDNKDILAFIKKFSKISHKESKELKKELNELNIVKMNEKDIAKIIDFLPEDAADLNKIVNDVSLDENEISKVLEVVKKYK